ncbi:angiotensin-converting enzyme-like [Ixodes scapularis]|uniref:angiotensin-converting enzyme-like n=1 Tax=Ixodes scapularis TaxID=6945 RepID=UPI001C380845|nr:angiotensin-converting enzyme-like [Ixodes scapularis]
MALQDHSFNVEYIKGYANFAASWIDGEDVNKDAARLWHKVKDFYAHLHAFVRAALLRRYGNESLQARGLIPVHLLGNAYGENWLSIIDTIIPRGAAKRPYHQKSSPVDVVKMAERYYIAMGFPPMPDNFWKRSVFERPPNTTNVDCHASAYDFGDGQDFRIKVCLEGSGTDLQTVIHEMGHVHYFMAYRHQPSLLRAAPLSALHEAIGECFSHVETCDSQGSEKRRRRRMFDARFPAVQTTKDGLEIEDEDVVRLLKEALFKVVPLPWILSVETWRYDVFQGRISRDNLAGALWDYRQTYQGIKPSIPEAKFLFDAGGKYHVAQFIPYFK